MLSSRTLSRTGGGLVAAFAAVTLAALPISAAQAATTATPVPASNPVGHVDSVQVTTRTARFVGWAVDRDAATTPVRMVRLVDGYRVGDYVATNKTNAAVTKRYHASTTPGFDLTVAVPRDGHSHTACVGASNIGAGTASLLKCVSVPSGRTPKLASHNPFGWMSLTHSATTVSVRGRATDPDFRGRAETVVLYVDGTSTQTALTQPVHGARGHGVGYQSAYSMTVPVTANQAHIACAWAVNVGPGANALLGCARFDLKSHATDPQTAAETKLENAVVALAKKQFNKPYVWAAAGPKAFDCSGLVQWTYKQNGYTPPRLAAWQYEAAHIIPASHARPGDLVFYYDHVGFVHHVGIYVGPGMTIAAMSPDMGIGYQAVSWTPNFDGSYVSYGSFTHS